MLIEFSVANFRSIKSVQTLSMVASKDASHAQHNVAQPKDSGLRVLKSAVIYGPNAAGKSNLLRALEALRQLVQRSATSLQEGQLLAVTPFRFSQSSSSQPSVFEIIFIAEDNVRYHYVCEVSAERIHREWLVAYPRGRAQRWFERSYDSEEKGYSWWFGPNFKADRAERKVWREFTRANALFLSTAIQLNNDQLKPAFDWLTNKLIVLIPGIGIDWNPGLTLDLLRDGDRQAAVVDFMRAAGLDVERIELKERDIPSVTRSDALAPGKMRVRFEFGLPPGAPPPQHKEYQVIVWHRSADSDQNVPLDLLHDESDGTKKLFEFIGGWFRTLDRGATLFVDELDRSLHPYLTRFLVGLFHGRQNTRDAQLVFTTHDTTLLDTNLFRRDQIWFVDKDDDRATTLYSMLDYSPRKGEAFERGYLKGRYGAIPFIRDPGL